MKLVQKKIRDNPRETGWLKILGECNSSIIVIVVHGFDLLDELRDEIEIPIYKLLSNTYRRN